MDDSLISHDFKDRIAEIDSHAAFELFMQKFEQTKGKFSESFTYVADQFGITSSEINYLYHAEDWAMKIVQRETENALVKEAMAKNTWLEDRDNLYGMGREVISQLTKEYQETGELPFNLDKIKEEPIEMERFVRIMETLASMKQTGNSGIVKAITINQQHNETIIDTVSGVDNDKINDILKGEGHIHNGEFQIKKKKEKK